MKRSRTSLESSRGRPSFTNVDKNRSRSRSRSSRSNPRSKGSSKKHQRNERTGVKSSGHSTPNQNVTRRSGAARAASSSSSSGSSSEDSSSRSSRFNPRSKGSSQKHQRNERTGVKSSGHSTPNQNVTRRSGAARATSSSSSSGSSSEDSSSSSVESQEDTNKKLRMESVALLVPRRDIPNGTYPLSEDNRVLRQCKEEVAMSIENLGRPPITDADLEGKTLEEQHRLQTMGFLDFSTTRYTKRPRKDSRSLETKIWDSYQKWKNSWK